jgi:hypothetical protein
LCRRAEVHRGSGICTQSTGDSIRSSGWVTGFLLSESELKPGGGVARIQSYGMAGVADRSFGNIFFFGHAPPHSGVPGIDTRGAFERTQILSAQKTIGNKGPGAKNQKTREREQKHNSNNQP